MSSKMTFQALLVSHDEQAAEILVPVLAGFGVGAAPCSFDDATAQVQNRFDAIIVDYDQPESAVSILQAASQSGPGIAPVRVVLLGDKSKVRHAFGAGANFVLYKPLSKDQAEAGLRAATALIKRERRRSFRVPVQVPVQLNLEDNTELEGILLDLSEDGMDVLAARPLYPSAHITCRFNLLDAFGEVVVSGQIAWANPNGQSGVRFVDMPEELRQNLRGWVTANAPELPPEDPEPVSQCTLTDLSLGGCYVQTESPFPERSAVVLALTAGEMEVQTEGVVRVMHPAYGMGIEFPSRTEEQRQQVSEFIDVLSSAPGTAPKLTVTPRALIARGDDTNGQRTEDLGDALLELLRSHESLTQEDFLRCLRNQRGTPESASS
jgi:CheY-like chemotaxis protein